MKLKYLFLKLKLFGICLKLQVLLLYGKDMRRVKETKSQFCPMFTLLPKRGSCLDGHVNSCFQIIMIVMFTMQLCMFAANCQHSSIFFYPIYGSCCCRPVNWNLELVFTLQHCGPNAEYPACQFYRMSIYIDNPQSKKA